MSQSASNLSWPARALIGAIMGCFFGALYLVPDWSIEGLLAAALAGAVSFSIIGALHGHWSRSPVVFLVLCSIAGGIGGFAWSAIRSTDWQVAVFWGATLGFLWPLLETIGALGSKSDPAD